MKTLMQLIVGGARRAGRRTPWWLGRRRQGTPAGGLAPLCPGGDTAACAVPRPRSRGERGGAGRGRGGAGARGRRAGLPLRLHPTRAGRHGGAAAAPAAGAARRAGGQRRLPLAQRAQAREAAGRPRPTVPHSAGSGCQDALWCFAPAAAPSAPLCLACRAHKTNQRLLLDQAMLKHFWAGTSGAGAGAARRGRAFGAPLTPWLVVPCRQLRVLSRGADAVLPGGAAAARPPAPAGPGARAVLRASAWLPPAAHGGPTNTRQSSSLLAPAAAHSKKILHHIQRR